MKVVSNFCWVALAFMATTVASRSWRLERVALTKLSTSASPPRIVRLAVTWVKVGVDSAQVSPGS